jgi:c-di-GMP-binding flagellar brake protein YcgR
MAERRNYVRLKKRLEIEYKIIIDRFASTAAAPNTTFTDTISGNGMSMFVPKKVEKGTRFEMAIRLPDGAPVDTAGEVIGVKEIAANQYEVIIKFKDMDTPDQDRLIKYILREGVKAKPAKKK